MTAAALAQATWPQVERARRRALVVPLGALEQHGPHLPLDTDTRVAEAIASAAAAGRPGVHVSPALPLGASGEHADFPGTLSIGREALVAVVVELVRHATLHWPGVLLVNGHGGNVAALEQAVAVLTREGRRCRAWTASYAGGDAHAGRIETSLLLALAPDRVHLDSAEPGDPRPLDQLLPLLRDRGVRAVSANGILGDPTGASAEEGRELLARLVDACSGELDALLGAR